MASLSYQIPDADRPKRVMRIPESHALYLCPNACGRRQGIRALRNGIADHVSFLRLTQADVISGDYERQVGNAVEELLATLRPRPRVVSLYVNCIDDFLGTDEQQLLDELRERFPDTRFLLSHINPIAADVKRSTARSIHTRLYEALEAPAAHDSAVTLVGHFEPLDAHGEFFEALQASGTAEVREIVSCDTFDAYLQLACSRFTVSLSHMGDGAADALEQRFGIPFQRWHACYDLAEITARYAKLMQALDGAWDGAAWRHRAERAVIETRAAVGSLPVAVDSAASLMPFSLARTLLAYGFNVVAVFGLHLKGCDDEAERLLADEHPEVAIVRSESYEALSGFALPSRCLALGRDAGFLLRAHHLVDIYHDEGYFGYHGVIRLMDAMAHEVGRVRDWGA